MKCPISGQPMHEWLRVPCDWRRPSDDSYTLFRAGGFGQLLPRPEPERIASFYQVPYYTHGQEREGGKPSLLLRIAWRLDFGTEPTPEWWRRTISRGPCLEIGCGDGRHLAVLPDATGVEPDPGARERAVARGLTVHDGTAENLPAALSDRRWNAVVMMHALEHTLDPMMALDNVRSVLAPGGTFVVEVPNNDCLGLRLNGPAWRWLDVPRHLNFFTELSLRAACEAAGFTVVKTEWRGYCRQYSAEWREAEARIGATMGLRPGSALAQLIMTAFAPARLRYDSVRLICRSPA